MIQSSNENLKIKNFRPLKMSSTSNEKRDVNEKISAHQQLVNNYIICFIALVVSLTFAYITLSQSFPLSRLINKCN